MSYPSYPPPDPGHAPVQVTIRPLQPLQPPPTEYPLPPLPSSHRNPAFSSSYTLTTHLYPSAYPHAHSAHLPRSTYADRPHESKEERRERQKALLSDLQLHGASVAYEPSPDVFWNVINRITRHDAGKHRGGVTLFLAHANGFPKEVCFMAFITRKNK